MKKFNEFTNVYADTTVSADVQTMLNTHFMYREVCDDDNFVFFWKRNLNRYYDKFVKLQLTETITDFDIDFKTSINSILTATSTESNQRTGNDKTISQKGTSTLNTILNDTINKELNLDTPQSIQYGNTQSSESTLDWTYVSSQKESSTKGSNTETSVSGSDTDTITYNSTNSITGSQSNENTTTSTGTNRSQTQRYAEAYTFISTSNSFDWFVSKLEVCFLGIWEAE